MSKLNIQWCNQQEKELAEELKIMQVIQVEVIDGQCKPPTIPPIGS